MDAVLLAGGYATRLYPLTIDRPKALLPLAGRPILDHIVDVLDRCGEIRRMFLVTNARFAAHFSEWARQRSGGKSIRVLNDGTSSNETRLGAIGDIQFVLDHADVDIDDGVYVLGTDNLARFDITEIIALSRQRGASAVFAMRIADPARLRRVGVVELDETGRVTSFEEKPKSPKSNFGVPPFYAYTCEAVALIRRYLDEGGNPDAPGHLVAWLVSRCPVYARVTDEGTYDIGTVDSYAAVRREFGSGA